MTKQATSSMVRRPNTGRQVAFLVAIAIAAPAGLAATAIGQETPGDAANGAALAQQWCANCHLVGRGEQAVAGDQAPPFTTVATYPEERLRNFLADPHPPMPDLNLARDQINDVIAYLRTLTP